MNDFKERLSSRKFLLTVAFGLLVIANKAFEFGISDSDLDQLFSAVLAFIGFEGAADVVKSYRKK